MKFNIKTIVYTNSNGELIKTRMRDYKPSTISLGRQFITRGYVRVTRGELIVTPKIVFDASKNEYCSDTSSVCSDETDKTECKSGCSCCGET